MVSWLLGLAVAGTLPALLIFWWLSHRYGTDRVALLNAPHYLREPPSRDPPALVGALVRGTGDVAQEEFLATFFDLIRRGLFAAEHEASTRQSALGLRSKTALDLRVRLTKSPPIGLHTYERIVYDALEWVIPPSGRLLSEFAGVLAQRRSRFAVRFHTFREEVAKELNVRGWLDARGRHAWSLAIGLLTAAGIVLWLLGAGDREHQRAAATFAGTAGIVNAVVLGALGVARPTALTRRAGPAVALARRWEAFARFLRDFSALRQAPPGSVDLWEEYLVYAVALGAAHEVVGVAQRLAPTQLEAQSMLYWFGPAGARAPVTDMAIDSLMDALRRPSGVLTAATGNHPPLLRFGWFRGRRTGSG